MIVRTAVILSLGLSFALTYTVLPRAKPDPNSPEPLPPVETVIVLKQQETATVAAVEKMTPEEQAEKIESIEDRLRTIQKTVNRIELKAKSSEGN